MKFHITDENGESCVVEEIEESKTTTDEDVTLTSNEISMLKSLAANADKLLALLSTEKTTSDEDVDPSTVDKDEEDDTDIEDADEDKDIDTEKVIDTDEDEEDDNDSIHDSVGSIKKSAQSLDDSLIDDVSVAWAKRYGG